MQNVTQFMQSAAQVILVICLFLEFMYLIQVSLYGQHLRPTGNSGIAASIFIVLFMILLLYTAGAFSQLLKPISSVRGAYVDSPSNLRTQS